MRLKALLIAEQSARLRGFPNGRPTPTLEVLGAPLTVRIAEALMRGGVTEIVVVTDITQELIRENAELRVVHAHRKGINEAAEQALQTMDESGTDGILVLWADQYVEADFAAVLKRHTHFHNRVTRIWSEAGATDAYLFSPGRQRDIAALLRSRSEGSVRTGVRYMLSSDEYANLLRTPCELRRLSQDTLYRVNQIEIRGTEGRPGVWMAPHAIVERGARVVGPAYIGERARVCSGAVVTRDSVLEHHTCVDHATIVEDAWIQPHTAVGAGLDVTHAIASHDVLYHLEREAAITGADGLLLREVKQNVALRATHAIGAWMARVAAAPAAWRERRAEQRPTKRFEVHAGGTVRPNEDVAKLAPGLALMRRYGNE